MVACLAMDILGLGRRPQRLGSSVKPFGEGEPGRPCKLTGVQLGLSDCLIGAIAVRRGLAVMTTDRPFGDIARVCGVRLERPA